MDDLERQLAATWFNTKWQHGECPVCHVERWEIYPRLGQITNHRGGHTVPVLLVGCGNCGYTVTANAIVAGVLSRPEPDGPDGSEP
jgi:hypothetical protein